MAGRHLYPINSTLALTQGKKNQNSHKKGIRTPRILTSLEQSSYSFTIQEKCPVFLSIHHQNRPQ